MKHLDLERCALAEIGRRLSYIDSIRLRTYRKLPAKSYLELLDSVRSPLDDGKSRVIGSSPKVLPTGQRVYFLTIHQPTFKTLDLLEQFEEIESLYVDAPPFEIVRVDVALDLVVKNRVVAAELLRHIVARLLKSARPQSPWHYESAFARLQRGIVDDRSKQGRKVPVEYPDPEEGTSSLFFETAYLGYEARRGVRVCLYADRPTKTSVDSPCCHLEWRMLGASELRRAGLGTIAQLRALDYRAFWAERLRMAEVPSMETLAASMTKRRRKLKDVDRKSSSLNPIRSANSLLRSTYDRFQEPNAHDLLLVLQAVEHVFGERPIRRFLEVSHDWMLPCRENSLWDDIWERAWRARRMIAELPAKTRRVRLH